MPDQNTNTDTLATDSPQSDSEATIEQPDFNGAAIVDEDGNEIKITEAMVQNACENLDTTD